MEELRNNEQTEVTVNEETVNDGHGLSVVSMAVGAGLTALGIGTAKIVKTKVVKPLANKIKEKMTNDGDEAEETEKKSKRAKKKDKKSKEEIKAEED